MSQFSRTLDTLRWDDHRYYHQSRINQSLHFVSALGFLCAYALLFTDPALASLVAWLWSMTTRQAGHFFFEPKGYDAVNHATHEFKESVKVGYNLNRKVWLLSIWVGAAFVPALAPDLLARFEPMGGVEGYLRQVGLVWLVLGVGGLAFRTVHLCVIRDVETALAWFAKIVTDPFHDVKLYYRAPLHLLRGERLDPMRHREPS